MINFIRTKKKRYILGVLLSVLTGISAGCTTQAETSKKIEPPAAKKEAAATTQTPSEFSRPDPYSERQFEGDMDYSTPASKKTSVNIDKATFEKIKIGMSLEEVEKLVGEKGMLVGINDINGRKTQIYKWTTDGFSSYIDVIIENGKVAEKRDKNLK
jgi:hypothetical protein